MKSVRVSQADVSVSEPLAFLGMSSLDGQPVAVAVVDVDEAVDVAVWDFVVEAALDAAASESPSVASPDLPLPSDSSPAEDEETGAAPELP